MKQLVQRAAARDDTTGEADFTAGTDGLTGITDEITDERAGAMQQKKHDMAFFHSCLMTVTSDLEFIFNNTGCIAGIA